MADDQSRNARDRDRQDREADGQRGRAHSRLGAREAMRSACVHLHELTGKDAEGVIRIEPDDSRGWRVALEVLELKRIPDTTDVLASYELQLDEDGELVGYRRIRRYARAEQGEEVQA